MTGVIEGAVALGGLILPPAVDFIKKKFLPKDKDTPEATMSALATTNPDILPQYVDSSTSWLKAKVDWFNRDVIGAPSQWVVNLRAAIRPACTVGAVLTLGIGYFKPEALDPGTRYALITIVSSWFGDRLTKD